MRERFLVVAVLAVAACVTTSVKKPRVRPTVSARWYVSSEEKCENGVGKGCRGVGYGILRNDPTAHEKAFRAFWRGCRDSRVIDHVSCIEAATYVDSDFFPRSDRFWAMRELAAACEKEGEGCARYITILLDARAPDLRDVETGRRLGLRDCAAGRARICVLLDDTRERWSADGSRDFFTAGMAVAQQKCAAGSVEACLDLEAAFAVEGRIDALASLRARASACDAGSVPSCAVGPPLLPDAGLTELLCARGDGLACSRAAATHPREASALRDFACSVESGTCNHYASLLRDAGQRAAAIPVLRTGCDAGQPADCLDLLRLDAGDPPELATRVQQLAEESCGYGELEWCDWLDGGTR